MLKVKASNPRPGSKNFALKQRTDIPGVCWFGIFIPHATLYERALMMYKVNGVIKAYSDVCCFVFI